MEIFTLQIVKQHISGDACFKFMQLDDLSGFSDSVFDSYVMGNSEKKLSSITYKETSKSHSRQQHISQDVLVVATQM